MISKSINIGIILVILFGMFSMPSAAYANGLFGVCSNGAASGSTLCGQSNTSSNPLAGPNGLLLIIANVIAIVAGLAAVIIIIISGLRLVTSGGDPSRAAGARSALIYAIVGLVIIALADTIISLVLSRI
ncbi:MAG: hypothetical protein ACREF5_01550 [Candidatus Saccharimonadales bacterium]